MAGLVFAGKPDMDAFNEGAVYSPNGMLIQFDNGTIWQRGLPPPPGRR